MDLQTLALSQVGVAGLAGGLTQVIKMAGFPSKYAGILSAVLGLVIGVVASFVFQEISLGIGIFEGLASGLSMSGAYSTTKSAVTTE